MAIKGFGDSKHTPSGRDRIKYAVVVNDEYRGLLTRERGGAWSASAPRGALQHFAKRFPALSALLHEYDTPFDCRVIEITHSLQSVLDALPKKTNLQVAS